MFIELMQKRKWCVFLVLVFLSITVYFGYMNFYVDPGGIVDNAVMNEKDIVNQGDQVVKSLQSEGLRVGDAVVFSLPFLYKGKAMKRDLDFIREFTEKLHRTFPEYKTFSLSNMPRFREVEGKYLRTESYIDQKTLSGFDHQKWKKEILRDPKISGVFVAPDFSSANVILTLPHGYDEMDVGLEIIEFLMDEEFNWYERYTIEDIVLAPQFLREVDSDVPVELRRDQSDHELSNGKIKSVLPAGWSLGRVFMTGSFYCSLFWILGCSIFLAALTFWMSFADVRQTVIALLTLVMGLIWTRGSIALLQWWGFTIEGHMLHESVYFVFVFVSLIVSGISFTERKFDSYNGVRKENPRLSRAEVWKKTKANPMEVVDERIIMTCAVAVFGFGTLYQIEIRQILEVGFFSALGLLFLLVFTLYLVPPLHILLGGEHSKKKNSLPDLWWRVLDWLVEKSYLIASSGKRNSLKSFKKRGWLAVSLVIGLLLIVSGLLVSDHIGWDKDFEFIEIKTRPLEFIDETLVHEASRELNKPGKHGFDRLSFIIRPKSDKYSGPAVHNPDFLKKVNELQKRINSSSDLTEKVRQVYSVADMAKIVSRENYGVPLPQTKMQAIDSLRLIRSEIGMEGKEQLWCNNGVVIQVSVLGTDSNRMSSVLNRVLDMARDDFPSLQVDTFGKLGMYVRSDKYLRERKPMNAGMQNFWIFLFTFVWIAIRNWRFRAKDQHLYLSGWRSGAVICLPFIFASSMIAILMMILRIPLDQATACITALTVNAAIDFSLYVVADYQALLLQGGDWKDAVKYAIQTRGRVVLIDVAINSACFAPLMISPFSPIARVGGIMMVMLIFCGIGAMVILPLALPLAVKVNDVKRRPLETAKE